METKTRIVLITLGAIAIISIGGVWIKRQESTSITAPLGNSVSCTLDGSGACGGTFAGDSPVAQVSSEELSVMLRTKDFFFANVHVPYEGEIEGTDVVIPYERIAERTGDLPADKNAMIVLYCKSGRMSTIAAKTLASLGYTNVTELRGGMDAWGEGGYQLIKQ